MAGRGLTIDGMSADAVDRTSLDPDAVAGHAFGRSRKGYEVDEVRAFLVSLSSQIREAQQQRGDMERRLAELERRAVDPKDLDADAVTQLLGEETGRLLTSARKASVDIRARAEEEASTLTDSADTEATATRAAADQYADGVRTAADEASVRIRTEADAYDTTTRAAADTETAEQRKAADEYATSVRSTTDAEVAQLRATATAELDQLRKEADTVMADRTADAEVAAGGIRADADTYSSRVRDDADRYAEAARAAADSYRADVQGAADAYREAATAEGDKARTAASADAETTRKEAEAEVAGRRKVADAEVEAILADAREEGRAMVQEARTYRERVIADLADRRRAARAQLEGLASTRDALAVTLTDVASSIDSSHRALQDAVLDPRDLVDLGQDRRMLEADDNPGTAVAVGELDSDVVVDLDAETDLEAETEFGAEVEGETLAEDSTDDEVAGEVVEVEVIGADPEVTLTAVAVVPDEPEAEDEPVEEAKVDSLFARLRAEQEASGVTPEEAADNAAGEDEGDPDSDLLDRRDATTDDLERQLARRLKRVLSDEQNEALDLLRRTRGTPTAAQVLPSEADHLERYTSAALEDLAAAERAGAGFFGDAPKRAADVRDVAAEFSTEMIRQIRGRLERAFEDGGDENEVGERIRACYREWKTQRIADTARHFVVVAFSRGVAEAGADGGLSRWLVDDGDAPCPDCDDNALAGGVAKGDPFPTGDMCPPAHPGCRCLAVPVPAG